MTLLASAVITAVIFSLLGEGVLWLLFRRKMEPLLFPPEHDRSAIGFFRLGRVRVIALIHCIVLVAWCVVSLLLLW